MTSERLRRARSRCQSPSGFARRWASRLASASALLALDEPFLGLGAAKDSAVLNRFGLADAGVPSTFALDAIDNLSQKLPCLFLAKGVDRHDLRFVGGSTGFSAFRAGFAPAAG